MSAAIRSIPTRPRSRRLRAVSVSSCMAAIAAAMARPPASRRRQSRPNPSRSRCPEWLRALAGAWPMAINRDEQTFRKRRFARSVRCIEEPRGNFMKLVLTLLGVVLLVVAAVYFLLPADQLPGFFPGHQAGVSRMHTKHGIVSGVLGLVLIGAGTFLGRR